MTAWRLKPITRKWQDREATKQTDPAQTGGGVSRIGFHASTIIMAREKSAATMRHGGGASVNMQIRVLLECTLATTSRPYHICVDRRARVHGVVPYVCAQPVSKISR